MGGLEQASGKVLAIVFALIILGAGLLIADELYMNTVDSSATVTNETLADITEAGVEVAKAFKCGFSGFAVTSAYNESGTLLEAGNYTVPSSRNGRLVYSGGQPMGLENNSAWNVTYGYSYSDTEACAAMNQSASGLGELGDWIDLIVIVIAMGIIITIIMKSMSGRD